MNACEVWYADDFLHRRGFVIETDAAGRTATRGHLTYLLDGSCQHPPEQCPPHRTAALDMPTRSAA